MRLSMIVKLQTNYFLIKINLHIYKFYLIIFLNYNVQTSNAILIPSFNSNSKLSRLIDEIRGHSSNTIIVVDDGSDIPITTDVDNVEIVRNSENRGKGYSLRVGFDYAASKDFTHVITMDSDLQHSPNDLTDFLEVDSSVDFVLGYREKDESMPFHRKLSNSITSLLISKIIRLDILDSQCGFRRYSLSAVKGIEFKENGFQFESEVLIKAIKIETNIKQVKVRTIYDKDNKSYINHVSDTLKFIRLILRSLIRR